MSVEILAFKTNKLNLLTTKYIKNCNATTTSFKNYISIVSKSRTSISDRQRLITQATITYNTMMRDLRKTYETNLTDIRSLTAIKSNTILSKKALLIGINYVDTQSELSGCINDVDMIENKIQSLGFNHITRLTDESEILPTRDNIIKTFTDMLVSSQTGDLIFIYYSGHGSYTLDRNNDETDGYDEMIISLDFYGIRDDELRQIINANVKKDVTIVCMFDSCYSGTVLDLKYQYLEKLNYDSITENELTNEIKSNVIMISGCTDAQFSYETVFNNQVHGAMSWAFVQTLNQTANITSISWRQLLKDMRKILKTSIYAAQYPQLSSGCIMNMDDKICF